MFKAVKALVVGLSGLVKALFEAVKALVVGLSGLVKALFEAVKALVRHLDKATHLGDELCELFG